MRKNSIKNIRINEEVMRELSNIIRGEIKDPRINPMTSVVAVEVAPDLKTAKAYISVLGDEQSQKDTLAGLKSAEGFIRVKLAKSINLRNTPEIKFVLDQSIEYGIHMSKMIDEVTKDIKEKPDVIILDPPRDGIHPKALPKILSYGVDHIVYISCKATSLARDLPAFLAAGYKLEKACCVDQFCQTVHVETVVLLSQLK